MVVCFWVKVINKMDTHFSFSEGHLDLLIKKYYLNFDIKYDFLLSYLTNFKIFFTY